MDKPEGEGKAGRCKSASARGICMRNGCAGAALQNISHDECFTQGERVR